jgi:quinol monooxygenase YgiN
MIVVSCILNAKRGKEKELEETLRTMFPPTRNEAGVLTYVLHRSAADPCKFLFYERYRDKEALDQHMATPHFRDSSAIVNELLAQEPLAEFYEEIDAIRR